MFNNITEENGLRELLTQVANKNVSKSIRPGVDYIPVTGKVLDAEDLLYGVEATLDGWLTTGRFGPKFEQKLAKWFGCKSAIVVNSG
ncbi:MAG: lipopolysaccharide biosynthesis protein RfbH, partial [Sphingobacteriaceae bacterium]